MPLDKADLDDAEEFLDDIGKEAISERVGDQIEDETERLSHLVELKNLVKNAEEAGLADDPAVVALRDRVVALSETVDIAETRLNDELPGDRELSDIIMERYFGGDETEVEA